MERKAKYSFETKLGVVLRVLAEETTTGYEAEMLHVRFSSVGVWAKNYQVSEAVDGL